MNSKVVFEQHFKIKEYDEKGNVCYEENIMIKIKDNGVNYYLELIANDYTESYNLTVNNDLDTLLVKTGLFVLNNEMIEDINGDFLDIEALDNYIFLNCLRNVCDNDFKKYIAYQIKSYFSFDELSIEAIRRFREQKDFKYNGIHYSITEESNGFRIERKVVE